MAKSKTVFVCSACGYEVARWMGKCPECEEWNTLIEQVQQATAAPKAPAARHKISPETLPSLLEDIEEEEQERNQTGIAEFDRVLGGGVVPGSLVLIGGDPGIGKSTLLLQVSARLARDGARVLYVSGEESARQIKMRSRRLGVTSDSLYVLAETSIDRIEAQRERLSPDYMVVDSIQTMYRPEMSSAPGSVSQVRESAAIFMRAAKDSGTAIFLVGHVTKEGSLAGPRVLEHMVDAVLYFEGDGGLQFRILRAVKNRFGSVNELGIFEMRDIGMVEVPNPSELLLSRRARDAAGSVVVCAVEGSRPVLCDLQALVAPSPFGTPRRMAKGIDSGRLALLLAVLEKRAGLQLVAQDVYANVAGGLELSEPAADLALCAAIASSLRNRALPGDWVVMGEVGLAGEVRAISQAERRLSECLRLGFTTVVIPRDNLKGLKIPDGLTVHGVDTILQALATFQLSSSK